MADISQAFGANSIYYDVSNNVSIDHFFTQRKIVEQEEYIDEKNMTRKKRKNTRNVNFLAINLPTNDINPVNYTTFKMKIQLWGDKGLNFEGTYEPVTGIIPSILVKLNDDTQIFINLIMEKDENRESYISFIQVPKRYQVEPNFTKINNTFDNSNIEI